MAYPIIAYPIVTFWTLTFRVVAFFWIINVTFLLNPLKAAPKDCQTVCNTMLTGCVVTVEAGSELCQNDFAKCTKACHEEKS